MWPLLTERAPQYDFAPLSPYLSPACCCTASFRCSPASSRTPTGTSSTGRQQSPTPGSSLLPRPGRAPGRRTPVRPASAASAGSCAPTPPSRWQQTTWRGMERKRGGTQSGAEEDADVWAGVELRAVKSEQSCCCYSWWWWGVPPQPPAFSAGRTLRLVRTAAAAHRSSPPCTALTSRLRGISRCYRVLKREKGIRKGCSSRAVATMWDTPWGTPNNENIGQPPNYNSFTINQTKLGWTDIKISQCTSGGKSKLHPSRFLFPDSGNI